MACEDWTYWAEALSNLAVRDAVLCPYQTSMGGIVFASLVVLGIVNLPIYIRQESVATPLVLTLILGGIFLTQTASMAQGLVMVVVLMVIGIGPVLVLRRIQTPA